VKIVVEPAKFHWTEQTPKMPISVAWRALTFASNIWVTVSANGGVATSSDGVTFVSQGTPLHDIDSTTNAWWGAFCGSDEAPFRFIALSQSGKIAVSSDGITWQQKTGLTFTDDSIITENLDTLSVTGQWYSIVWGNGRYVATHFDGHVITSENGVDWVYQGTPLEQINSGNWLGCTWDGEKFMSIYKNGYLATSPDGINWRAGGNSLTSVSGSSWHNICYDAGVYVAIMWTGTRSTATSTDGINWINQGEELKDIATDWSGCINFQNGKFLAISSGTKTANGSYEGTIKFSNIGDDTTHTINRRTEFYIEPSQMTANEITFEMNNIRLISAEITNRPYKKTVPSCGVDVDGNTATITTNIKAPLTVRTTAETSSVTFYNDNEIEDCRVGSTNGTSVALNSPYSLSGEQTFVFKGAPDVTFADRIGKNVRNGYSSTNGVNFGHNLSKYKVRYSLNNSVITNCVLKNQVIRHYMGHYGCNAPNIKPLIINTGVLGNKQTGGTYMPIVLGTSLPACDTTDLEQVAWLSAYRDSCITDNASACRYNLSDGIAYGMVIEGVDRNYIFSIPGVSTGTLFAVLLTGTYDFYHSSNGSDWIDDGSVKLNSGWEWTGRGQLTSESDILYVKLTVNNNIYQYYLVNAEDKLFIPNITEEDITNNRGVGLQTLSGKLSDQITAGNYIVFQGDGELHVTVEPVPQITRVKPDGVEATTSTAGNQVITISPETHLYEEQPGGTYKIMLTLNNVQISDAQPVNPNPVFEYPKLRMPEMSRVIDFSQKASDEKFVYNICGDESSVATAGNYFMYADDVNTSISRIGIRWNANTGNWEYYNSDVVNKKSPWNHFWCMNYPGDMYLILNVQDKNQTTPQLNFNWWYRDSSQIRQYFDGGLIRAFNVFATDFYIGTYTGDTKTHAFEIYNVTDTGIPPVMAGLTMPINAILFHGASGSTKHHYAWQSSKKVTGETPDEGETPSDGETPTEGGTLLTDGGMIRDATAACRAVTADACAKLKTDNPNLRIYVVKYRKQVQYKHKILGTTQSFDYDYIDKCASEPKYAYEAATEIQLAEKLQAIADDVKSWSGYQAAKNVP
jgi:hypothetical protein